MKIEIKQAEGLILFIAETMRESADLGRVAGRARERVNLNNLHGDKQICLEIRAEEIVRIAAS